MAKETARPKGFSLDPDDAEVGQGLFGAGPAIAKSHRFGYFKYPSGPQAGKKVCALLVDFTRDDEKHREAMTVGKGFKPSDDGLTVVPQNNQTGLPDKCKCILYLKSLKDNGCPKNTLIASTKDISEIDGIEGTLIRKPMEKSEGMTGNPSVLLWDEIEVAPWNGAGKAKKKAELAEEDDEDEKLAKKGKKAVVADDDDDSDDSEADEETAGEALIEALEDGALKLARVEAAVRAILKGHTRAMEIAALACSPKFLKHAPGISFDGRLVELDK